MDLRLKSAATIILSGSSGCGKTQLAEQIVCENKNIFTSPFEEVVWCFGRHADDTKMFIHIRSVLEKDNVALHLHEGCPYEAIESNTLFEKPRSAHKALIIDDLFSSPTQNKTLQECFSVLSHHLNITVILIIQNLQAASTGQRVALGTLLRSCSHLVVFVGRRMLPIVKSIGSSFFPGELFRVLEPFNDMIKRGDQHNYIVFDFLNSDSRLQVREKGLLPSDKCWFFLFSSDKGY